MWWWILAVIVLLIYAFVAITNPDIIWDMRYRHHVEGGEPSEGSLKSIVFSGKAAIAVAVGIILLMIFAPDFLSTVRYR